MKIFNYFFAFVFLAFAIVQYNDPDPLIWVLIYGAMAVICLLAAIGKFYPKVILAMSILYLLYAVFLIPGFVTWLQSKDRSLLFDDIAKMQNIYIEETREFLGLMICLAVLAINYFFRKKI